jgi:hypothetical protein
MNAYFKYNFQKRVKKKKNQKRRTGGESELKE